MEISSKKLLNELSSNGISRSLLSLADLIRKQKVGNYVYFRGLIEISNVCQKNCYYCGLRKDNKNVKRYTLTEEEVVELALLIYKKGIRSLALQSGEIKNEAFFEKLLRIIRKIKEETKKIDIQNGEEPKGAGITGSFGELEKEHYEELFKAGVHRYLLRIETSNRELYEKLHPSDHSFEKRLKCLKWLKEIGYQVGTGVIIGIPGQTYEDLVNDLLFFKDFDIDMIGMGPYIEHRDTPIFRWYEDLITYNGFYKKVFELSIKMIAFARILLEDVNIVASTALQSVPGCENALELGIKAGANVVMPVFTPYSARKNYRIYEGKKNLTPEEMSQRIKKAGYEPVWDRWGDPLHFFKRNKMSNSFLCNFVNFSSMKNS
ncbi:[FeFe] hydrogenase H-cluster radical SAM maturase HydE [Desulfurobacterium thermolithotrophum]|uniref:[FeFe] hydrogenase H-cluster radical SAM maturase HydE n=1 Tax=Desulfurobacterium thermolithotrophum TaxID=64160 RepID=UPI0013D3C9E1|nr:[FeFe] hydrogenase H-cluster radical SAM maturase HydE [Desulfurobacterium thermolithotrophum]